MDGLATKAGMRKGNDMLAEVIGVLFMSRTYSHMAHLKTPSYSKHMALNEFYDNIVELADTLAEAAQGLYGKLNVPFVEIKGNVDEPITTLEAHLTMVKRLSKNCGEPYLDNIMQEIEAQYRSTLYKLRELS